MTRPRRSTPSRTRRVCPAALALALAAPAPATVVRAPVSRAGIWAPALPALDARLQASPPSFAPNLSPLWTLPALRLAPAAPAAAGNARRAPAAIAAALLPELRAAADLNSASGESAASLGGRIADALLGGGRPSAAADSDSVRAGGPLRPRTPEPNAGLAAPPRRPAPNDAVVDGLTARLMAGDIHTGTYASEGGFLTLFERLAKAVAPGERAAPLSLMLRLLERVIARYESLPRAAADSFGLNVAILADDLYLSSPIAYPSAPGERERWARIRSAYGQASVRTLASLGIPVPAGASPPSRRPGRLVRAARTLLGGVPGAPGRLLREMLDFVQPVDIGALGFPSISEKWARSARHRAMLALFYRRLRRLQAHFDLLQDPPSIWELALKVTNGDAVEAGEMLGGIIGQTKRPLRYVEKSVMPRFADAAGADEAFADAAKAYYLLGELHERGLARFGRSPLYPDGERLATPKFWHYYAAAMTARHLRARGHGRRLVRAAGAALAAAYEAYSIPFNLRFDPVFAVAKGLPAVLDSIRDVMIQAAGGRWASGGPGPGTPRRRRIGFLTGTFDPPHDGHLGIARLALDNGLDEVWLLPQLAPRHKPGAAPFAVRRRMTEELTAQDSDLKVLDERTLRDSNGDVDALIALFKNRFGGDARTDFFQLLGEDSFRKLSAAGLIRLRIRQHRLWIFSRPRGEQAPPAALEGLSAEEARRTRLFPTRLPVSSSEIRTGGTLPPSGPPQRGV